MLMKNNATKTVLINLINKKYTPGITTVQNAPGSGKSHAIAEVIAENLEENQKDVWVYLTTDKQNRNNEYEHIKKLIPQKYHDQILLLKSNQDFLLDYFASLTKKANISWTDTEAEEQYINDHFLIKIDENKSQYTYELMKTIIHEFYLSKSSAIYRNAEIIHDNLSINLTDNLVAKFIKISRTMTQDFNIELNKIRDERKKNNENTEFSESELEEIFTHLFPWYKEVFPNLIMKDYRCVIMTAHKFFFPVHAYNDARATMLDIFKNRHVNLIMDEADQIKNIWLDQIIESIAPSKGKNYLHEDIFVLFRRILQSLNEQANRIPQNFINKRETKEIFEKIKQVFEKLTKKYHLNCNVQIDPKLNNNSSHFIFNYGERTITVDNNKNKERLVLTFDDKRKINVIKKADKKYDRDFYLDRILYQVKGAITFFMKGASKLAFEYSKFKKEQNEKLKYQRYTLLAPQEEVLYILRTLIPASYREENYLHEYLMRTFLERRLPEIKTGLRDSFSDDPSMFNRGFSYYNIVDNPDKEAMSHVYLLSQLKTPEKMLVQAASKWRIFMISATVDNDSSFSNFDFKWLTGSVNNISSLNKEENKLLDDENNLRIDLYKKKVNTKVSNISINHSDGTIENLFKKWIKQWSDNVGIDDIRNLILRYQEIDPNFNPLAEYSENDQSIYYFVRNLKTADAIIKMCQLHNEDKTKQSFVIYRNAKTDNRHLNWFKDILKTVGYSDYMNTIISLIASNKRSNLTNVKKDWENGEFRILLTTFATLDRGVNLQYRIPNDFWKEKRDHYAVVQTKFADMKNPVKDLDGIYIEKPTHVFTSAIRKVITTNDILHFFFEQDELFCDGLISYSQKKTAIQHFLNQRFYKAISKMKAAQVAALVKIEQALGRISRVEIKNKEENIFLDADILPLFTNFNNKKRINGLMTAIVDKIDPIYMDEDTKTIEKRIKLRLAFNKMNYVVKRAYKIRNLSVEMQQEWVYFRELIAKHPFLDSMEQIKDPDNRKILSNCYWEFSEPTDHYYYAVENDYQFLKDISLNRKNADMKKLDMKYYNQTLQKIFSKNPWLKEKLNEEGYETDLSGKHKYLLTPGMFNNFYKAAISEKIFELVARHCSLAVYSMRALTQSEFEMMDGYFKTKDGQILYYDMKNYDDNKANEYDTSAEFEQKELNKLAEMQGNSAIIINFFDWTNKNYRAKRIINRVENNAIYIYPCLFRNNGELNTKLIEDLKEVIKKGLKDE